MFTACLQSLERRGRCLATAVALGLCLVLPSALYGQEAEQEPLVTNMFYDTSLRQALADISAQTGVIIVPDMSVQGIVTCELKDVPLTDALRMVLSVGDYVFREMDGYILVGSTDPEGPSFSKLSEAVNVRLEYVDAESAVKMLPESLQKFAKADEATNTVCVTAPSALAERLVADLRAFDVPPRQVMIEAKVVELQKSQMERFGTDWEWEWQKPQVEDNTRSGSAVFDSLNWTLGLGYATTAEFTRNLNLTLTLLEENESASILANPRVMAADGKEAEIRVITEEYFEILTGDYYVRSELEQIESGIVLKMRPRIGDDGDIVMEISPEVSNVIGQGLRGFPVITRRSASTTVHVQDGGTIVIAGLVDNSSRVDVRRVPLLGSIPLIGALFRSDQVQNDARQVAVFITPRIVGRRPGLETPYLAGRPSRPHVEPAGEEFQEELERILFGSSGERQQ